MNLLEVLTGVANNNELTVGAKAIEQKQRNAIKKELTEALMETLQAVIGDNELIKIYRTEKGIMLGVDNEKVGIIPVEFQVAIKNMDCDPADEEEAYKAKLEEAEAKKQAQAKAKEAKMKRDAEERALKEQLKAMKKAGLTAGNNNAEDEEDFE